MTEKTEAKKDLARVDSLTSSEPGELPQQATSPSERLRRFVDSVKALSEMVGPAYGYNKAIDDVLGIAAKVQRELDADARSLACTKCGRVQGPTETFTLVWPNGPWLCRSCRSEVITDLTALAEEASQALAASAPPLSPDSETPTASVTQVCGCVLTSRLGRVARSNHCEQHASPASPPRAWQPIESAPKDGTLIIGALIRDGKVWRVHDMKHNGLAFYTVSGHSLPQMTHWIALPDPPGVTRAAP